MSEQGPPAPLTARSLTVATLVALVIAGLALTVYILPANYGLDPVGVGSALGIDGQPPAADEARTAPEPVNVSLATQLHAYRATWPTATEAGPGTEGYTAENETTTIELGLPHSNVTEATVTLTWTDDNETAGQPTEPDELELVVEAPDGTRSEPSRAEATTEDEATVEITLPLHALPEERTIHAAAGDDARRQALGRAPDQAAGGAWKAHVTVVDAGDAQTGGLGSPDGSPAEDEGTDWQLASTATTYRLSLEDTGPADLREDEQTFGLAPGEGMEHKITVAANATVAYAWRATGEVSYDFHGEPANGTGFTSHGTGTTDEARGTFTAPFTGTHGWYWENEGEDPVAITLVTNGDYTDGFTT